MSRKNNDDVLSGLDRAQSQSNVVPAPGDAAPSPDVSDASGQMLPASAGNVSHAGAAPVAELAADATTAVTSDVPDAEKTAASNGSAPDRKPARAGSPKKSRFRTARGWVALACVAFALAGMAFRVGIGTPSAFGIQQISAICPLGALETMAGAKGVMLHPLLLFALVVVLIALVGKAFCAWMCPVPWLQKFFRPKKRGTSAKSAAGREAAASCGNLDAGSAQAGPLTFGAAEADEPQIGTASDASCQRTRECVLPVADECANDALYVATAASGHATNACVADSEPHLLDSARTRAIFGSKTAEPGEKHLAGTPSACAACAGASACAKALAPVGGARDGVRLDSRHAVLVGTLASAAVFGFPVFCLICPVGLTFATIIGLWNLVQFNEPTWALVVFPAILIAEVTVLRKWCSKICPISALVSLLSNLNVTLRPRVKADACLRSRGVDCHACVDACPEQLDPHSRRIPECSKCGKCVEACPAKAISIKLLK
ncbi:4Fe-4S binding protein [uncultured Senegalimassilia sp.]|uniref:4Fe-4S binding protein n=1 Tax=uncultured Senegalimassilia sp. TaxID=1714350 RepID=UPI0025DC4DED|nr:4Fe-4S binding protein [uncultured Senegalimassilia sp.]